MRGNGISVTSYRSPDDDALVVEIDTGEILGQDPIPETSRGPIRVYLNECSIYENPPYSPKFESIHAELEDEASKPYKVRERLDEIEAKKKEPEKQYWVVIRWVQRGHSTQDPTGQNRYRMECTWKTCSEETLKDNQIAAYQYGVKRVAAGDWDNYEVEVIG